jgi:predicted enzyme related to lactoylglutathione lyase
MLSQSKLFTAIATKDLAASRTWFEEKLGVSPSEERPDGLIFTFAEGSGFLLYETQFAGTAKNTVAGWEVADLDAEMQELRSRGVTFVEYDLPGVTTVDGVVEFPGGRAAWFVDPDGNTFSLASMQ